jgi:hypothetical protein
MRAATIHNVIYIPRGIDINVLTGNQIGLWVSYVRTLSQNHAG